MKIRIINLIVLMLLSYFVTMAHTIHHEHEILHHWTFIQNTSSIEGSFYMLKEGNVYLEDANEKVMMYPISSLSVADQEYVLEKQEWVKKINEERHYNLENNHASISLLFEYRMWLLCLVLIVVTACSFYLMKEKSFKYLSPILLLAILIGVYSFAEKANLAQLSTTNPLTIDSAFAPFKPNVNTRWDATYFYVESKGIPSTHYMMKGITNWQQQVPIPQCYLGNDAWSVPLNPVMAATPVPVSPAHFSRGAIAIAVNGVPIFNPYTNTGVDAFLDGQLDDFGGHCGRADDYHYHIAPLSLYMHTSATLPIAYALDGFAVYGSFEPEGGAMTTLDANHGHIGANGVYHYHGSSAAPYMIANMVGQVTEDATFQIVPQAAASPIRPGQSPLPGAVITDCRPNAVGNGYTLIYTLGAQTDSIVYSWNASGLYTFNFYAPSLTTSNYTGFTQCALTSSISNANELDYKITVFPNPVKETLNLQVKDMLLTQKIRNITLYDNVGTRLIQLNHFEPFIDVKDRVAGIYFLEVQTRNERIVKKILIQ